MLGLGAVSCRCDADDQASSSEAKEVAQPRGPGSLEVSHESPIEVRDSLIGGALFRHEQRLFVADEDHGSLRRVELPLSSAAESPFQFPLPGAPAQVVAWETFVAVTVREPSLLLVLEESKEGYREKHRVSLPADAWGLAITPDRKRAWVTSAWASRVSLIDLEKGRSLFDYKVGREPRALALSADGETAYVTHLTRAAVTVLHATGDEDSPVEETILEFPAAPLRTPTNTKLSASLAYSSVLSPDGQRLYVPRHALGALGKNAWFGAMTLDVLLIEPQRPLSPVRAWGSFGARSKLAETLTSGGDTQFVGHSLSPVTQPRAVAYRSKTKSLLVIGEGDDRLAEFDALAVDPTLAVRRVFELGRERHPHFSTATICGAPTGLALSSDEDEAYVYCRATDDLVAFDLRDEQTIPKIAHLRLADSPEDKELALGRAIYLNATDRVASGGLACSGCHPEGRDDGHVWHEATFLTADGIRTNFVGHQANIPKTAHTLGVPRRTPMLAGRLKTKGPFGWHGESKTLPEREIAGFALHRWGGTVESAAVTQRSRALFLAHYLRRGLVAPAARRGEVLTVEQARGEEIFLSERSQCASCHVPETHYTNQQPFPLPPLKTPAGFNAEEDQAFKTPSLRSLVGRAPYFHDGSAPSLFNLIETNHDRMGKTSHLSRSERDALIAFLETL